MSDLYRAGEVYVRGVFAGVISETDTGYMFSYDRAYLDSDLPLPLSITMPLRDEEYTSSTLFSFFDGLIPEGWLLDVAVRSWKINRSDRFGLLLKCCRDCIGDVSVKEADHEM